MNRSAPLSPEARRLLELGAHVDPPAPEQNERMDRALAALFRAGRVGATIAASSTLADGDAARSLERTERASGASPARGGLGARPALRAEPRWFEPLLRLGGSKPWLVLGALTATASASFWLGRVSSPAEGPSALDEPVTASVLAAAASAAALASAPPPLESRAPAPAPPAPAASEPAAATSSEAPLAPAAVETAPFASAPAAEPAAPPPAAPPSAAPAALPRRSLAPAALPGRGARDGLAAEIEQLARAEAALRQGRAQQALAVLEQRTVVHLLEQAAALRAIAGCELGQAAAASAAREVLVRWPASAFHPRIAHACGL